MIDEYFDFFKSNVMRRYPDLPFMFIENLFNYFFYFFVFQDELQLFHPVR